MKHEPPEVKVYEKKTEGFCEVTDPHPLFSLAPQNSLGIITWPEWCCHVVKEVGYTAEVAFGLDAQGERVCWARRTLVGTKHVEPEQEEEIQ